MIQHKQARDLPSGPVVGDDRYWFHLLPSETVASLEARPEQKVLLKNRMQSVPMDFVHTWLAHFLRWIPTMKGNWDELPESRIFVGKDGAIVAKGIFHALTELASSGPSIVAFPGMEIVTWKSGTRSESVRELAFPRQELVATFEQLTDYARIVEQGQHLLFCSYWLQRP